MPEEEILHLVFNNRQFNLPCLQWAYVSSCYFMALVIQSIQLVHYSISHRWIITNTPWMLLLPRYLGLWCPDKALKQQANHRFLGSENWDTPGIVNSLGVCHWLMMSIGDFSILKPEYSKQCICSISSFLENAKHCLLNHSPHSHTSIFT